MACCPEFNRPQCIGQCVDRPGQPTIEDARRSAAALAPQGTPEHENIFDALRAQGVTLDSVREELNQERYRPSLCRRLLAWMLGG